jgi:hypothetical protein
MVSYRISAFSVTSGTWLSIIHPKRMGLMVFECD